MRALVLLPLLGACAPRSPASYEPDPVVIDRALSDEPSTTSAAPRRVPEPHAAPSQVARAPRAAPRRSRSRVTLHIARAPLGEVLRLLASEAGLGVVLASTLDQPVSLDVVRADPLAVLDALASAHRLEIEQQGSLIVVRPAGG